MIDLTKYRPLAVGEVRREGDVFRSGSPVPHHGSVKQGDEGYVAPVFRAVRLTPDGAHRLLDVGERRDLPGAEDSYTCVFSGVVTWERDPVAFAVRESRRDRCVESDYYHRVPWPPPEESDAKPERCPIPGCIRAPGHVGYHAAAAPEAGEALLAENSRLKKRLAIAEGLSTWARSPDRTVSTCVTSSGVVMRNFDRDAPRVDAGRVGWTGPMTASDWPAEVVIDEQYGEEFDH